MQYQDLKVLNTQVAVEHLGGEVIPRSVLFAEFEGAAFLLVALGDGHLFNWVVQPQTGESSGFCRVYKEVLFSCPRGWPPLQLGGPMPDRCAVIRVL